MSTAIEQEVASMAASQRSLLRRGFLAGSLAGGFALAVAPSGPLLAQVIKTDSDGLLASEVKIPVAEGMMAAYRAQPADKSALATVIVVQEIFGVHEYIRDICRRFAKAGLLAIAPDLFSRQGDPTQYKSVAEVIQNVVAKVPDVQVMADLDATARWAASNNGDAAKLAITGFCWGGRIVWLYSAHSKSLQAGVAWYGRLTTSVNVNTPFHPQDIADKLAAPVLGLYGGKDDGIPQATVEEMQTRLSFGSAASKASQIQVYPDAPHGFHADYRPSYRPQDAQDGFKRCLAWFAQHGVV
jgi:carboxymethylenebutenolidase